jgi:hypothetical protein
VDAAPPTLSRRVQVTHLVGATLVFGFAASLFLQSWRYGLLVTVSFGLHELGHILVLSHYGIPWEIRLSLVGVATVTPREARRRLSHYANSQIHLAGPALSLAQALIALIGYALSGGGPNRENWLLVANLASLLVILNVLPLGTLSDGGQFIRRLFHSLSERSEEGVTWSLLFWLLSITWLITVNWGDTLRTLGTLAVAVWFILVMLRERQHDETYDTGAQVRMTRPQGILLFSAMATGLLWATGITALTPFWLRLDHLETMAFNIAFVLVLLQRGGPLPCALILLAAGALVANALYRRAKR